MRSAEFFQRASRYLYVSAILALLPSVISLAFAVWSAASTGQVTVISLGNTATSHALVPWRQGWARFGSTPVLIAALYAHQSPGQKSSLRIAASMLLAVTGVGMLCFSQWFTSLGHAMLFYGLCGYLLLAHFVDARFGRAAATVLLLASVSILLYIYAAA